jgi:hypothetical protein
MPNPTTFELWWYLDRKWSDEREALPDPFTERIEKIAQRVFGYGVDSQVGLPAQLPVLKNSPKQPRRFRRVSNPIRSRRRPLLRPRCKQGNTERAKRMLPGPLLSF